jgi:hypothetical protein
MGLLYLTGRSARIVAKRLGVVAAYRRLESAVVSYKRDILLAIDPRAEKGLPAGDIALRRQTGRHQFRRGGHDLLVARRCLCISQDKGGAGTRGAGIEASRAYLGGKHAIGREIDETNGFNHSGAEGKHVAGLQNDSPAGYGAERGRYQSLRAGKAGDPSRRSCGGGCEQQVFVVVYRHVAKIAAVETAVGNRIGKSDDAGP